MKLKITKKYLVFPVNTLLPPKNLYFKAENETLYQLGIKLDNCNPNFYAYVDVSRFAGREIEITTIPQMEINFRESDIMDIENLYNEPLRPQVHFTAKNGWINDPNGLIYLNGIYHMFYQHHPSEPDWDNSHWGHAESRDLIHWEEKDIALFPDSRGGMLSGCAVYDEKNLLAKNDGKNNAALMFYTTAHPYCQHMSYSVDNFKTIKSYGEKPIVPHIIDENRDPKVIFCEELECYIMALYLEKDIYCILKSENLTDWRELQRIQLNGSRECPDIFPLCCSNGERKWVFIGANDKYLVGNFKSGKFIAEQSELRLHYGSAAYAGQSFSNLPDGRIVRMVWDMWSLPAYGFAFNFKGQMGIPMEISLCKYKNTYYLEASPIKEIKNIYKKQELYNNVNVNPETSFVKPLDSDAQLLRIKSEFFTNASIDIEIFGRNINFNFEQNEITLGACKAPISITHNKFDITIIADRCSIELFADDGKIFLSCLNVYTLINKHLPYLSMESSHDITLESIEVNSLASIWEK